jgi:hypothetical protein
MGYAHWHYVDTALGKLSTKPVEGDFTILWDLAGMGTGESFEHDIEDLLFSTHLTTFISGWRRVGRFAGTPKALPVGTGAES